MATIDQRYGTALKVDPCLLGNTKAGAYHLPTWRGQGQELGEPCNREAPNDIGTPLDGARDAH
jgi:hypothetical protein